MSIEREISEYLAKTSRSRALYEEALARSPIGLDEARVIDRIKRRR